MNSYEFLKILRLKFKLNNESGLHILIVRMKFYKRLISISSITRIALNTDFL